MARDNKETEKKPEDQVTEGVADTDPSEEMKEAQKFIERHKELLTRLLNR